MARTVAHSTRFWLWLLALLIIVPVFVSLIFINQTAMGSIRVQAADNNLETLKLYLNQIDNAFDRAGVFFSNFLNKDQSLLDLRISTNETKRQLAKVDLFSKLSNSILLYNQIDSFFYYADYDDDETLIYTSSPYSDSRIVDSISRNIKELLRREQYQEGKWSSLQVNDDTYFYLVLSDRGSYVGAWVSTKTLLAPLDAVDLIGSGYALVTSEDGSILSASVGKEIERTQIDLAKSYLDTPAGSRYLQVSQRSGVADFNLVALIPDQEVTAGLSKIKNFLLIMLLICFLALPLSFFVMQIFVIHPVSKLVDTMRLVRSGNLEAKITKNSRLREIQLVYNTFNDMISEIKVLKISIYEQRLRETEAQLQYLQLQIHPHFILNSMNLIHGLAELGQTHEIKNISQLLASFLRYTFKNPSILVSIEQELMQVRTYLNIARIRYPGRIKYVESCDEALYPMLIPPLIIQSFVENAIKYGMSNSENCIVEVAINNAGDILKIRVKDNGPGFPLKILTTYNKDEILPDSEADNHIGLRNVLQRLKLIYGKNSLVNFYNSKGAVVEIVIPIKREELKEE